MSMHRAYAVIELKSVDEDKRVITGVATTPTPDRMGDIVEPLGVSFKNPLPLLWQHISSQPVGFVKFDKPTKKGITFTAELPNVTEPGTLKDRIDEAWQSVKHKLVRAVSIGFRSIEYQYMDDGIRFVESEVLELSLVTIPANADAMISSVKSFDARLPRDVLDQIKSIDVPLLAATGKEPKDSDRPTRPAPGKSLKPFSLKGASQMTLAEQIAALAAQRVAKAAAMNAIQQKAIDAGRTKDAAEREEFDTLAGEIASIDAELIDLRAVEKINLSAAVEIRGNGTEQPIVRGAHVVEHPNRVEVRTPVKLAAGIRFTRYVMATIMAKGNPMLAVEIFKSKERWMSESPEILDILKTAVTAGSTSDSAWASPLVNYNIMAEEFIEFLRPLTILGRIVGLTHVPFKVKIPRQTGGATVNWVGEGAPKPVSALAFDSVTLDNTKIAGIIVLNEELMRLSTPSAELLVRNDLAKAIVQFMDSQFVDPSKAAVAGVSPASITNGVTPITASGTTGASLRSDMKALLSQFLTANMQISNVSLLMSQRVALGISLMTNSLGQKEFPGLTLQGGDLLGLPVITSENIPSTGGSPTDGDPIIVLSAPDILLADDGQVSIDASREASLQMDTAPDSPATASTTMVSLWQQNQIALRAERWVNWVKRRSTAVSYIQNAKYFE